MSLPPVSEFSVERKPSSWHGRHPVITDYLPYAQFAAQIALIVGAFFAGYQFLVTRTRGEEAALQVLTRLQSPEFRAAYAKIWTLRLGASAELVRERGPEMEDAIECVAMTFESLGVMVHNPMVPIDIVDQVIGGFLRESGRRSQAYILWKRQEVGSRRLAEWYQWLAEHLAVESRRSRGAYEAFKDWEP